VELMASYQKTIVGRLTALQAPLRCWFCRGVVTADDYCFGCRVHVCEACDKPEGVDGVHQVSDHRSEPS
jgi:hypothetical protein